MIFEIFFSNPVASRYYQQGDSSPCGEHQDKPSRPNDRSWATSRSHLDNVLWVKSAKDNTPDNLSPGASESPTRKQVPVPLAQTFLHPPLLVIAEPGGASTVLLLFLISDLIWGRKRQLHLPLLGIPVWVPLIQQQPGLPGGVAVVPALGLGPGRGGDSGSQGARRRAWPGSEMGLSSRPLHTARAPQRPTPLQGKEAKVKHFHVYT